MTGIDYDVIIVGGGPAGLAVAIGAARVGLHVVVVEQRSGSIDKACGEGLMPGALRALQALGVDPPGPALRGITYRQDDAAVHASFRNGSGRAVRRTALHDALRERVRAAGVPIIEQKVTDIVQFADHVEADGLQGRYLVGADGLHSRVRTNAGLDAAPAGRHRDVQRWGLRRHYAVAPWTDFVEVTWSGRSEAYVTPVADDTIGVAILSDERAGFDDHLAAFPRLASVLDGATPVSTSRGAGPLRQRCVDRVHNRVLLVGDAAGYIDALTGEGLALALTTAAALVRCVVNDAPQSYAEEWVRVSRRSRWLTAGLLRARNHRLTAERLVPVAARMPWAFGIAVRQLAR